MVPYLAILGKSQPFLPGRLPQRRGATVVGDAQRLAHIEVTGDAQRRGCVPGPEVLKYLRKWDITLLGHKVLSTHFLRYELRLQV